MKSPALSALVSTLLLFTSAHAKEITCAGQNLMAQMKEHDPETAKQIEKAAANIPYGKGLLWKVSKPGLKPSYLFGTMHLSDPRLTNLPANAQKAFDSSSTLALEITEILDPAKMAGQAMKLMKYTAYLDGSSLEEKMTPGQIKPVKSRLREQAGLPWNVAQKMRPWVVMGSLALPACELARKQAGLPFLDMALGLRAKQGGKKIVGLETLESQMATMASLPDPMMVQALVDTAKMGDQLNDIFETMIALYQQEETGTVWTVMRHLGPEGLDTEKLVSGYAEFQRVVVDERNVTMADESAKLIDKGSAFIAVGALHLPGVNGILSILAQRGYTVNQE